MSITIFLLLITFLPSIASADITTGLVSRWTFDGDMLDSSGQGHNGTFQGGTPSYIAGQIGQALGFDGVDDVVTVGTHSALFGGGAVTVSAWLCPKNMVPYQTSDHVTVMPSGYTAIEQYINELADALLGIRPP